MIAGPAPASTEVGAGWTRAHALAAALAVASGAACFDARAGPEWSAASTISATSLFATTGGSKLIKLCASIPAGQYPLAGNHTDTVRVTATYS